MGPSSAEKTTVAIVKGNSPEEAVLEGIEKLGGISRFINKRDKVFIKFNLRLPNGFPTNTNFDVLKAVINSCKARSAEKIYIGSFPYEGIPTQSISDLLELSSYFEALGAELAFLDNSNYFKKRGIKAEQLRLLKNASMRKVQINNEDVMVPRVILDSDKLISINQVSVDPIFKCHLSILNSYSIISNKDQKIRKIITEDKKDIDLNQYKQDLISKILDVYNIKKPDLVINDLFYLLEGAGPFIYKDSKLKKTGLVIIGDNAVSVDSITVQLLNLEILKNDLLERAQEREFGTTDISNINIIGENIENNKTDVELCAAKLEDINIKNISIKPGKLCSGCYNQAYHLLNLMKTNMVKDLKYISQNSFLIGENPLDPDFVDSKTENVLGNILLFGDCAINSTIDRRFRKIVNTKSKKGKPDVVKEKPNKNILEIHGCPPDLFDCIKILVKFYGKDEIPTLNLFYQTVKSFFHRKIKNKLENWEVL